MLTVQDRIKAINQKEKEKKTEPSTDFRYNNKVRKYRTTYIPSN